MGRVSAVHNARVGGLDQPEADRQRLSHQHLASVDVEAARHAVVVLVGSRLAGPLASIAQQALVVDATHVLTTRVRRQRGDHENTAVARQPTVHALEHAAYLGTAQEVQHVESQGAAQRARLDALQLQHVAWHRDQLGRHTLGHVCPQCVQVLGVEVVGDDAVAALEHEATRVAEGAAHVEHGTRAAHHAQRQVEVGHLFDEHVAEFVERRLCDIAKRLNHLAAR